MPGTGTEALTLNHHSPDPESVRRMFATIASRYDLLNLLLSLGRDGRWRRRAAALANPPSGGSALDICCGTGDLARILVRRTGSGGLVVGADFCEAMLLRAKARPRAGVAYLAADAHALPFGDGAFDCATIAFGLRNVADPEAVLREMTRVVRSSGRVVCLEFGLPEGAVRRRLVRWYERTVVPYLGGILSRREAYEYLSRSISEFAEPAEVRAMMVHAGLVGVGSVAMHLGSVYAHVGLKQ